ncbi:MAG: hypothetical protein IKD17_07630 [Alistipes sp.]|nr:hypothetical protein [Alistipes sp.]
MKHLLRYMVAITLVAFAAACGKEDAPEAPNENTEVTVTFSTSLPVVARGAGEGKLANELHYAVYLNGDLRLATNYNSPIAPIDPTTGKATLNLALVNGYTYDIVFWAQSSQAPYGLNWEEQHIAMNYSANAGNNEHRDAFIYVLKALTINGATQRTIELKRPFAQLNIGVSDYDAAAAGGFTLAATKIKAQACPRLKFFGANADEYGIAEGALEPVTFAWATPLTGEDATFEVAGKSYKRVSTNYLLIGGNTLHSDALNIDIAFSNEASGNGTTRELFTFNAVPVERNHRTNIVGTLLTSPANREIVVNP